jgi:cytochrome oxidase Cu insertion factor (SCO1/SenC/PrrC family)
MHRKTAVLVLWVLTLALLGIGNHAWTQDKKEAPPPPPEPKFKVGDMAPDFTLLDTNRKPVSLHDFRGKKSVALAFYIFAFSGG